MCYNLELFEAKKVDVKRSDLPIIWNIVGIVTAQLAELDRRGGRVLSMFTSSIILACNLLLLVSDALFVN